ncbi:unnamed protein product [Lymnaea stagnalis]|uniref:Uncharacterized protein n=1 Tax=Lymnaea stagnalis TaxID=6523 RepID=A0AAV2I471_LYMST
MAMFEPGDEFLELAVALGGDQLTAKGKLKQLVNFTIDLLRAQTPKAPNHCYNFNSSKLVSMKDLQHKMGTWLNLRVYLNDLFGGADFPMETPIYTSDPAYFGALDNIIKKYDKEVQANYLVLRVIFFLKDILHLPPKAGRGSRREKPCFEKTLHFFGVAAVALYAEQVFKLSNKPKITTMAEHIKQQMIATLGDTPWLEARVKERLVEKARNLSFDLGYPDWITDASRLDDHYGKITVDGGDFLKTTLHAMEEMVRSSHTKNLTPTPQRIDVLHHGAMILDASTNTVFLTVNRFQPPVYGPNFPSSFVYGSLGVILGHEVTHAFDNMFVKWDENGLPLDIWTQKSDEEFTKRTECLVDQYNARTYYGVHLNGSLTLQENICDNNGVRLAFKAYKAHHAESSEPILPGLNLTDDQLFFLGFSQVFCLRGREGTNAKQVYTYHSPYPFRTNVSLANYEDFAKAFNCPVNSNMNPVKKCAVWE